MDVKKRIESLMEKAEETGLSLREKQELKRLLNMWEGK